MFLGNLCSLCDNVNAAALCGYVCDSGWFQGYGMHNCATSST